MLERECHELLRRRRRLPLGLFPGRLAPRLAANGQLDGALGRLLAIVENYPNLKSNQNFLALQDELAGTENRIAVERRRYNEAIQDYNTFIGLFPNSIVSTE